MSYSISISGHKNVENEEEGKAFEQATADKAKAFVATLEGVGTASGTFGRLGAVNLKEES